MTAPVDITVIIPTFHREQEVTEAVESVLQQTGVALEVIVLDDSEDGSARSAVEAISDPRVRYIKHAAPSGGMPGLVRNDGIALAHGRFLQFLDDDDRLADGALAALAGALERDPGAGVAIGIIAPFGEDEAQLAREKAYFERAAARVRARRTRLSLIACLLFKDALLVNSACLFRREIARAIGGYDPRIMHCEDADLVTRAVRCSGFAVVDHQVVHYRTGRPSRIHSVSSGDRVMAESYRTIQESYKAAHGRLEFYLLRLLACAIR